MSLRSATGIDMYDEDPLPRDSFQLIDMLDKAYPHRCVMVPMPGADIGQLMMAEQRYAGTRQLIDELLAIKEEVECGSGGDDELGNDQ